MKMIRVASVALAVVVSLAGCSINIYNGSSSGESAGAGESSAVNWSKLTASADHAILKLELAGKSSDAVNGTLTVQDGHEVVLAGDLDEGSCAVAYSQDGESLGEEVAYDGVSVSGIDLSAGTYDIDFIADDATGTVYVLSYPADVLEYGDASPSSLYETVLGYVSENM